MILSPTLFMRQGANIFLICTRTFLLTRSGVGIPRLNSIGVYLAAAVCWICVI